MTTLIKPKALQKGDLAAIAAPAGHVNKRELLRGVERLRKLGFEITFRKDIFSKDAYLAGSDDRRAEELNQYFADPNVKAIFFARGGYGTQRVLPLLDPATLKANPKVLVGYSDPTSLFLWLHRHGIGGAFYGPTVAKDIAKASKGTIEQLLNAITSTAPLGALAARGLKVIKDGSAEGTLVGGCLSLITSSIGTQYDLTQEDAILFLEDVDEPIYKYDCMLTQLKNAGRLRGVKGIVFGTLGLRRSEARPQRLVSILKEVLHDFPGPIVTGFPAGHLGAGKLFVTLPLGVRARLETRPLGLKLLEEAVAL